MELMRTHSQPMSHAMPQIGNVGFMDVKDATVSAAVKRGTLFIHGSTTGGGGRMFSSTGPIPVSATPNVLDIALENAQVAAAAAAADLTNMNDYVCKTACGGDEPPLGMLDVSEGAVSTVCDPSCAPGRERGMRFDGYLCGAGDDSRYGRSCRACYTDPEAAAREEMRLSAVGVEDGVGMGGARSEGRHVIMCDTLRPPSALECSPKCDKKVDTVRLYWCVPRMYTREYVYM